MRILPNLGAFEAEVNRMQHRWVEANTWAAAVDPLPLTWSLAVVDPRLVQARVFLLQERAAKLDLAAQILAELQDYCAQVPNRRLKLEVDTLQALLQVRRGHDEDGMEMLERAVLTAETEGWVRLFVDLGPGMEALLTRLAARGVAPHYLAHVLSAFPAGPDTSAPPRHDARVQLIEPLTDRELDVLTLLAQRFSNKEIAARLFIAPATVKHHTLSIYRKLDASDRRQAVALAEEMGLLSMHA
jgi:LuxR family maltose regulon positive regulatory protein